MGTPHGVTLVNTFERNWNGWWQKFTCFRQLTFSSYKVNELTNMSFPNWTRFTNYALFWDKLLRTFGSWWKALVWNFFPNANYTV